MNITKFIPKSATRAVAKQLVIAQKNSPRVLFVAGLAGAVTSTVLACRATLKLNDVLDDTEHAVKSVKTDLVDTDSYHKDLVYAYAEGAYRIGRLYGPAVIVGSLSIAALTGSHVTLTRRNAGLTAAYAAVSKAYDDYRDRVKEELGEERERDIYHAVSLIEVKDEEGKKHTIGAADPNSWSPYAKFFDEYNVNWVKNAELNRIFVQAQQNYANQRLQVKGHVFLNEVYDMLGLERSKAGQVVGWTIGQGGDNYIDFGLFEAANADFINGVERSIVLDFNVDGVIVDKVW